MSDIALKENRKTLQTNRRALNRCLDVFRSISDAKFELLLAGRNADADKLDAKLDDLEKSINSLRGKMLDDWSTKVPDLLVELGAMNTEVQDAVDGVGCPLVDNSARGASEGDDQVRIPGQVVEVDQGPFGKGKMVDRPFAHDVDRGRHAFADGEGVY